MILRFILRSQLVETISGIAPIPVSTLIATIADPDQLFRSGWKPTAWIGLTAPAD